MAGYSEAILNAQALLRQQPLPEDAEQQLAALEQQIHPDEAPLFGDLWEAFYAASGSMPELPDYPTA